jgi:hypothetical protein
MKVPALPHHGSNNHSRNAVMDQLRRAEIIEQEPLGIIISRGPRAEETPRLSAYIWGPVPVPEPEDQPKPAAA